MTMWIVVLSYLVLGIPVLEAVVPCWGPEKILALAVWPIVLAVVIWMEVREARRPASTDYELLLIMLTAQVLIEAELKKKPEDWKWN